MSSNLSVSIGAPGVSGAVVTAMGNGVYVARKVGLGAASTGVGRGGADVGMGGVTDGAVVGVSRIGAAVVPL